MRDSDNKVELFLMFANSTGQISDALASIIATVNKNVTFSGINLDFRR